jgi:LmbE family N-acetylglucosaminyl deacetylase
MNRLTLDIPLSQLGKKAVIFSPHPDDECLACAGTILRKKKAGASVKVVHMTDGRAPNHANLLTKHELKNRRHEEALNAADVLGLSAGDTYFLDYEDGRLHESNFLAEERVLEILREERPEEVFVPYTREPMNFASDHVATTNIVAKAFSRLGRSLLVWEYPVWFWAHWPWIPIHERTRRILKARSVVENSLRSLCGARALIELRYSVDIHDVLEDKRAALAQHRSQMERIVADERWLTLEQIAEGEFLERFYQPREFFRRSECGQQGSRWNFS